MIDTTDLPSYISGYDEYCETKEEIEDISLDLADMYHDEEMIRKEFEKMERRIIDLKNTNLTFDEIMKLKSYVWKEDLLIPVEEGE